jgi:hypothetical protein
MSKQKNVAYKRASFNTEAGGTLEELVKFAVKKRKSAWSRHWQIETGGDDFIFLNYNLSHSSPDVGGTIFGVEFVKYERGAAPGAFVVDEQAEELEVSQILADTDKRQAIDSMLYAGVRGNHVILMQSSGFRSKALVDYLNWLLKQTGAIDRENHFDLLDPEPRKSKVRRGRKPPEPNEIVLKSPVSFTPQFPDDTQRAETLHARGQLWPMLKNLLSDYFDVSSELSPEGIDETKILDVELRLKWKGKGERPNLLSQVSKTFSHVDDELAFTVTGDGIRYTNKDFKVEKKISIEWGKIKPKPDDLFPKLLIYLHDLIKDEKIEM